MKPLKALLAKASAQHVARAVLAEEALATPMPLLRELLCDWLGEAVASLASRPSLATSAWSWLHDESPEEAYEEACLMREHGELFGPQRQDIEDKESDVDLDVWQDSEHESEGAEDEEESEGAEDKEVVEPEPASEAALQPAPKAAPMAKEERLLALRLVYGRGPRA